MYTVEQHNAAFHAREAADFKWQDELLKAFGVDACNRRYDPAANKAKHPANCQAAYAAFLKACEEYRKF